MAKVFHIIYRTTCSLTNRYYYGMHSTNNLNDGYLGSGKFLRNSINKHGIENHICEHLEFLDSREKLKQREIEIVNDEMLSDPLCMNLKKGGEGGGRLWSSEHANAFHKAGALAALKIQRQRYQTRLKNDPELYQTVVNRLKEVSKDTFLGKHHSDESKKSIGIKNSINQSGTNNSRYGTCWITNEKESKTIQKGDLIPDGWRLGRKMPQKH